MLWGPYDWVGELYCGYWKPGPWELKVRRCSVTSDKTQNQKKSCPHFCKILDSPQFHIPGMEHRNPLQ